MFKITTVAAVAVAAAAFIAAAPARAAGLSNGDFSSGTLAGWTAAGNAAIDTSSSFGPPAGGLANQAVMGTAATASYLFGGGVVPAASLDTFTGLPAGTFAGLGAVVGSAISQTFSSGAGDTLSFSWKFMSDEPQGSPAADTAFIVLDGVYKRLTNVASAVFVGGSASPMLDETAYTGFSTTLGGGSHTLVFGVFDAPDVLGASALAVSGVALQAAAVPEPQSWALMLAGAAALGSVVRRRSVAR